MGSIKRVENGDGVLSLAPDDDENSLDDRRLGKHYLPNTTYHRLYTYSPLFDCRQEIESGCPELQPHHSGSTHIGEKRNEL